MGREQIVSILGIRDEDLKEYKEDKGVIKAMYHFNGMYHVLYTEDITNVNEGSSVTTEKKEEAIVEYNKL